MKLLPLLAAALGSARAWTISSTPAEAVAQPRGPHEEVTKTWTIAGASPLDSLSVRSMGRVFVQHDASLAANGSDVVAKVVVSGDDSALLNAIEVSDQEKDTSAIQIRFKNEAFEGRGYLLTHVYVAAKQAIQNVSMAWSSDIIVGDDVLVQNDTAAVLGLDLVGSGDFFAGSASSDFVIGSLGVTLTGSGDIQLLAKSISVQDSVEIALAGSGDVAVVADETNVDGTLASLIAGSGDVFVQSGNLTTFNLSSVIAGSGDITYSHAGKCQEQNVVVVGSGDVSTASIVCVNTFVNLVGSGDILVQTTDNLTVASFFRGDIRYYGATPRNITASSLFDYGASHKQGKEVAKATKKNNFKEYEIHDVPANQPVYIVVKTSASTQSSGPTVLYALELDTFDHATVAQFLTHHVQMGGDATSFLSGAAFIVEAGMVFGFVVFKYYTRRRRHQYHKL